MDRPSFLDMEAPAGYVAGAGRGAIGFGDTGAGEIPARPKSGTIVDEEDDEKHQDGIEVGRDHDDDGISFNLAIDKDDMDAARIYSEIEERRHRNSKSLTPVGDNPASRFADLKRSLASISHQEWDNLQDPGDMTRKNKRTRLLEQMQQRSYAVPDSLIAGSSISAHQDQTADSTDFTSISSARNQLWGSQLDQLVALASNNPSSPNATQVLTETEVSQISDAEKARSLLRNLRKTRPDLPLLWISSARLEELAGDRPAAISILNEACRRIPHHEDLWLEYIRVQELSMAGRKQCKALVAQAIQYNRNLYKLWVKAVDLEHHADIPARRTVLMKALQQLPENTSLWEMIINLEPEKTDAIPLITKATELCPDHYSFWQSLIDASSYPEAKQVILRAHKVLVGKPEIWIAAAKLEEREAPGTCVAEINLILKKGFSEVRESADYRLTRMQWLEAATEANSSHYPITASQIVDHALLADCTDLDTKPPVGQWLEDALHLSGASPQVACSIYQYIARSFPQEIDALIDLLEYFRSNNDLTSLYKYYSFAITNNPTESVFPLMYAKDLWLKEGNVAKARETLANAYKALDVKHDILLAQIKLELRTNNPELAHSIYVEGIADIMCEDPHLWHLLIHLERHLLSRGSSLVSKQSLEERSNESRRRFPASPELLVQWVQIQLQELGNPTAARETARHGIKTMPHCVPLWLQLIELDASVGPVIKARTTLDRAMAECPDNDLIWCSKVDFELQVGETTAARQWAERALQRFPASPNVWLRQLPLIPKASHRRKAFVNALKATNNAPEIFMYIGKSLWKEDQHHKARPWFDRALQADRTIGDCWSWMTVCLGKVGSEHERAELRKKFETHFDDIVSGRVWQSVTSTPINLCKTPSELLEIVIDKVKI